ncbi:AdoMet-homocysteine methyltransferase [Recurvomyces mirabilis]|uniref:AdoMet-homocysteine methyltransferase n=1 Tax=Recurvomyces mirabilis TaxID=574656 RepID=A0AAE0WJ74_9PEZI|nr:AdoMet-homocysteine methyltransferase [Recurvomyces mirabilis]KAK5160089.1 AdoMet-homocysteine methyltransferase [Recurvomyces mirabilis]
MLTKADFRAIMRRQKTLVIDGALATELETRGHDLKHPLWSGKVLRDDPDSIQQVHLDYYLAGADVAITASYQASTDGLKKHLQVDHDEATELIKRSVRLAQRARCQAYQQGRDEEGSKLLIAGSVGPYGAYLSDGSEYRGDYKLTADEYRTFHQPRVKALVDAGVDMLAIETIPSMSETEGILAMLKDDVPDTIAWLSITLRDSEHMSDGTPLTQLVEKTAQSEQIVAIGVNCVPMRMVTASLQHTKSILEDMPSPASNRDASAIATSGYQLPLVCYPNSGETWNAETKLWEGSKSGSKDELTTRVAYWQDAGARLIGGCCRTGPEFVKGVAKALKQQRQQDEGE